MCPFGGKLVFIYNYFKARRGDGSRDALYICIYLLYCLPWGKE